MPLAAFCLPQRSDPDEQLLSRALGQALADHGIDFTDHFEPDGRQVVIAISPLKSESLIRIPRNLVLPISTLPGDDPRLDEELPIHSEADVSFAIHDSTVGRLRSHGCDVRKLSLGYHPGFRSIHIPSERRFDISYAGEWTMRTGKVAAHLARFTSERDCFFRFHEAGDVPGPTGEPLAAQELLGLLADSRVHLGLNPFGSKSAPLIRLLVALVNETIFLTEGMLDTAEWSLGEAFLSVGVEHLSLAARLLLEDPTMADSLRRVGTEVARAKNMDVSELAETIWRLGKIPGSTPSAKETLHDPASQTPGSQPAGRLQVPRTAEPSPVTVLITLYNYEEFIGDALESLGMSRGVDLEVIVVDDASTDGSVSVVESFIESHPDLDIKLILKPTNVGLASARNEALAAATNDWIFVMDADNEVFPDGIAKLTGALGSDPDAAFAYGILQVFSQDGPQGVLSHLPWSPARLVRDNYIDAMALIRKSAAMQVGGYSSEREGILAWEDYVLWLQLLAAGEKGVFLPEFVARYRQHPGSMLSSFSRERTREQLEERFGEVISKFWDEEGG